MRTPPIRYGHYNNWKTGNSGCIDLAATATLVNSVNDVAWGTAGYWFMYQGNWANGLGSGADGFPAAAAGELRTVLEASFVDTPAEGTINHRSWYMVASTNVTNDYDFDTVKGGTGCTPATIGPVAVPPLTINGAVGGCIGNGTPTGGNDNAVNPTGFFDIGVTFTNPSPNYYDEVGINTPGKPLIAGYQVVYRGGTGVTGASEPTSSMFAAGSPATQLWSVAMDATDPTKPAFFARGTATGNVALPKTGACAPSASCWYWLATRIIYTDASINVLPVTAGSNLWLASEVSSHCGPVVAGTVAVSYKSVNAERTNGGVRVTWETFSEDDTAGFQVVRSTGTTGTENIETLPSRIEARGAFSPYELLDYTVASDLGTTYTYYVQEITTQGLLGDRSASVTVPGEVVPETAGAVGGRTRGKSRR